ncbi:MAG: SufE family protein [Acidobacteriota bacterium]
MTLNDVQDSIVEEFRRFEDGLEKYGHLVELGRDHAGLDDRWKTDDHAVPGCQSTVWLRSERRDGTLHFSADSDSLITRGILSLLLRVFNDRPPGEIAEADLYFLREIGLSAQLSPTRRNGLAIVVREIRRAASEAREIQFGAAAALD